MDRPWRVVCGAAHTAVLCVGGRVYVLSARAYAPSPIQSAMISPIQSAVLSPIQNVSEGHAGYPGKHALLPLETDAVISCAMWAMLQLLCACTCTAWALCRYVWGDNSSGVLGNGGSWSEDMPRLLGCSDAVGAHGSSESLGQGLSGEYVTCIAASGWCVPCLHAVMPVPCTRGTPSLDL